jgi:hypothetical protein
MPRIITFDEKRSVIEDWLNGESREDIAIKHTISSGTVYNIVQEWANGIGVHIADRLRELSIKLNKNGLTATDCAIGLRILMVFKKYGITEDEDKDRVTYFLKEIYTKCQEVGLTLQHVFDYINDILKFSNDVSISQIPQFLKKRTLEKEELESNIQRLSRKIDELTNLQEEKEQEIQRLAKMKEIMTKTYKIFTKAKFQLEQFGIEMDDMEKFVKSVVGISKENHDPVKILAKIADYENLENNSRQYNEQIKLMKDELTKLNQDIDSQKKALNYHKLKLEKIDELEARGFNIPELRTLYNLLNEIGREYDVTFDHIREEFFDDVKNYEEVIGSRKEIDRLKNELKNLENETMKEREKYIAYPTVIEGILRLAGSGINEQDIIKIDKILMMTDYYPNKDKPLYKETLIDDLQKYGNLKLAIKNLEDSEIYLKSKKRTQVPQIKKGPTIVKKKTKRKKSAK